MKNKLICLFILVFSVVCLTFISCAKCFAQSFIYTDKTSKYQEGGITIVGTIEGAGELSISLDIYDHDRVTFLNEYQTSMNVEDEWVYWSPEIEDGGFDSRQNYIIFEIDTSSENQVAYKACKTDLSLSLLRDESRIDRYCWGFIPEELLPFKIRFSVYSSDGETLIQEKTHTITSAGDFESDIMMDFALASRTYVYTDELIVSDKTWNVEFRLNDWINTTQEFFKPGEALLIKGEYLGECDSFDIDVDIWDYDAQEIIESFSAQVNIEGVQLHWEVCPAETQNLTIALSQCYATFDANGIQNGVKYQYHIVSASEEQKSVFFSLVDYVDAYSAKLPDEPVNVSAINTLNDYVLHEYLLYDALSYSQGEYLRFNPPEYGELCYVDLNFTLYDSKGVDVGKKAESLEGYHFTSDTYKIIYTVNILLYNEQEEYLVECSYSNYKIIDVTLNLIDTVDLEALNEIVNLKSRQIEDRIFNENGLNLQDCFIDCDAVDVALALKSIDKKIDDMRAYLVKENNSELLALYDSYITVPGVKVSIVSEESCWDFLNCLKVNHLNYSYFYNGVLYGYCNGAPNYSLNLIKIDKAQAQNRLGAAREKISAHLGSDYTVEVTEGDLPSDFLCESGYLSMEWEDEYFLYTSLDLFEIENCNSVDIETLPARNVVIEEDELVETSVKPYKPYTVSITEKSSGKTVSLMMYIGVPVYSGSVGESANWDYDETTGLLSLTGSGAVRFDGSWMPWNAYIKNITSLHISSGITEISDNVLDNAQSVFSNLERIVVDDQNERYYDDDGVLYGRLGTEEIMPTLISYPVMRSNLNYTVLEGTKSIGNYAFKKCSTIAEVNLPIGLTEIGECAFWGCSALDSLKIPNSVNRLYFAAFASCTNLKSIVLPTGIERLPNSLLAECDSLSSVVIPANVKEMGWDVFNDSTNLLSVYFEGDAPVINDEPLSATFTFSGTNENLTLYFLKGAQGFTLPTWHSIKTIEYAPLGDGNSDGSIDVLDANIARRYAASLISLNESQLISLDVDKSGGVDIIDANMIRRYAVELISSF